MILMKHARPWLLVLVFGLNSCGLMNSKTKLEKPEDKAPFGPTGIPPELQARDSGDTIGSPVMPGGNKIGNPASMKFTPMEDIVFTDRNNPDAQIPALTDLLATSKVTVKAWEESESLARSRSARDGKPLLIWFTNSSNSPMCKALNEELLSTPRFEQWAMEKLVRLRVDSMVRVKDQDLTLDEAQNREFDVKHYVAELKKRYKVLGYPTLILLNSSGEVIGRYVGYQRGNADFFWGQLKHGEFVSTRAYTSWRADLEKKGYRDWQDRRGRKFFGKLVSYSKGELILIEPNGSRYRTEEDKLSDADHEWIVEQKKLRNMP